MRVALCDVDGHRWPNLCLMKLSACHKARGDIVEWWTPEGRYDLAYKSRVFTDLYSKDTIIVDNADQVICSALISASSAPFNCKSISFRALSRIPIIPLTRAVGTLPSSTGAMREFSRK